MTRSAIPAEEIIATYQATGSVWKTGLLLGLAGQTVHERLRHLGVKTPGMKWTDEEDAELEHLAAKGMSAAQIAHRLGRTYASVTVRLSRSGIKVNRGRPVKVPRGVGYDKVSMGKHLKALLAGKSSVRRYCVGHGMAIEPFTRAAQQHHPELWEQITRQRGLPDASTCPYCGREFYPMSGKQVYCTRKCTSSARTDEQYFGGKRRTTIGLTEGVCQLCGKSGKALSSHHVLGRENDPEHENLVALCNGCHDLVTRLAGASWCEDPVCLEALVSLAVLRRKGPEISTGAFDGQALYVTVDLEVSTDEGVNIR